MSYIGRGTDKISNIEKLDTITFDGSSSYTLQKNSVNFTPNSANSLQVSIDGVVQAGNFTVSGSTIDFGVAIPSTSTNDFIFHYGTGLITTPADGTVGLAQLSATGTKDATTFLRGDNTFATVSAGFTLGTQVSASGTSVEFTSIPSTARMIVINTDGLSFTGAGNSNLTMVLGDSGGYETSGYKSTAVYLSTNSGEASPGGAGATGDIILALNPAENNTYHGQIILTCQDTTNNTWNYSSFASLYSAGYIQAGAGVKSLSGTLDRIKLAYAGGQSFDAGTANIMYI